MEKYKEYLKKISPVTIVLAVLLIGAVVYGIVHYRQMEKDKKVANGSSEIQNSSENPDAANPSKETTIPTTQLVDSNSGAGRMLIYKN